MGFVHDRVAHSVCAFTGRKADDLRSWYTRQYTQEEADREKDAHLSFVFFARKMYVSECTSKMAERRISIHFTSECTA